MVRGCRTFVPLLKRQRSGRIVNVASLAGLVHPAGMASYNAVKAGVVALTETLGHELSPYGVRRERGLPVVLPDQPDGLAAGRRRGARRAWSASWWSGRRSRRTTSRRRSWPGIDAGDEIILPDPAARAAYDLKLRDRAAYDAQMRHQAARLRGAGLAATPSGRPDLGDNRPHAGRC